MTAMNSTMTRPVVTLSLAAFLVAGTAGCASLNRTEKGAIIGAASGAAVGGVVGKAAGSTTKGVIIGAVIGGAAGAVIGRQMDQKADELEAELENARVERVGEGILVTFESGLLFDFDSSQLRAASRSNLTELAGTLNDMADTELLIAGHTDSVGSDDYNFGLSERRAQASADYLMTRGVSGSRINIVGLGETEPVDTNDTASGRQANRRVEVAIYASEDMRDELRQRYGTN
jgi:outer membrane protein OmpA-like peptidoglycan-associated protein